MFIADRLYDGASKLAYFIQLQIPSIETDDKIKALMIALAKTDQKARHPSRHPWKYREGIYLFPHSRAIINIEYAVKLFIGFAPLKQTSVSLSWPNLAVATFNTDQPPAVSSSWKLNFTELLICLFLLLLATSNAFFSIFYYTFFSWIWIRDLSFSVSVFLHRFSFSSISIIDQILDIFTYCYSFYPSYASIL